MASTDQKETTVAIPSDQPGWRPDPEKPGMVRWWNGLGWSDARRSADEAIDRVQAAANDAARGSTISAQQVARTTADRRISSAVPAAAGRAVAATNPFAAAAVGLGIVGLLFGLFGILPLVGLIVSIGGLVRSRRLAKEGESRTGLGQSLAGLAFSVVGLLRWIPVVLQMIPDDLSNLLNG
jgi:hypothetical protein